MSKSESQHALSSTAIELPYASHPEFQFETSSARVSEQAVQSFTEAYRQLESLTNRPPGSERKRLTLAVQESLDAVFRQLEIHSQEPEWLAFVRELHQKCARVLADDLAHYLAPRKNIRLRRDGQRTQLQQLNEKKLFFGNLSESCLQELQAIAAEALPLLRERAASGKVTRDDLSINRGEIAVRIKETLNQDFARQGINDAVSAYAAKPMRVTGVALELSVPSAGWWQNRYRLPRAPHTLYIHTDESLDYPKAIVYLSDVTIENGPTRVYPGMEARLMLSPLQKLVGRIVGAVGASPDSALYDYYQKQYHQGFSSETFRRHFAQLPAEMQYNSHFGWDVLPDSTLEQALLESEQSMLGPAGTFVVFDGSRLLHRGGLVQEGERVALQVIFNEPTTLRTRFGNLMRKIRRFTGVDK